MTNTATESSEDTGQTPGDGTTREPSLQTPPSPGRLISFAEGSPAKTFPLLGEDEDLTANALVFGEKCTAWCRLSDQSLSSSKTHLPCSLEDSISFSVTLPRAGMMRNGMLFQLDSSDLPTVENGCLLLPTPTASDGTGPGAIMPEWHRIIRDGSGFPRRMDAKTDGTWSVGLARFTQYAAFLPLIPELSEWLMGYPRDWTESEPSETPSPPLLRNGSGDES